jgi:isopropylmalate/homocitrate/citramalate synthase
MDVEMIKESGGEGLGSGLSDFPVVGEEFVEAVHGVGADAVKDIPETHERVDVESFAGLDEAGEDRGK